MDADERYRLETEQRRGEEIRRFLNSETVQAVFTGLELTYFGQWKSAEDPAAREKLHATVCALDDLRTTLQAVVSSGDRATLDLQAGELDTDQT